METNILLKVFLFGLVVATILNCQNKIRQGASWAYNISIALSILLMSVSLLMLAAFYKASPENCNYIDYSSITLWGVVFIAALTNIFYTKKIEITATDVVIHPLIGSNKNHTFCDASCYTIKDKHDRHYAWKELTIFFQSDKIHISSLQHRDFVIIHNQLVYNNIPQQAHQ